MEVKGKIHAINNEQQVSASFRKRELVVKTEDEFPQYISINFVQDKCDLLNGYKLGTEVSVSINLRGREWTNPQGETKYFNDIQGWRISTVSEPKNMDVKEPENVNPTYGGVKNSGNDNEPDDLPF